jgi:hypothetical protein
MRCIDVAQMVARQPGVWQDYAMEVERCWIKPKACRSCKSEEQAASIASYKGKGRAHGSFHGLDVTHVSSGRAVPYLARC